MAIRRSGWATAIYGVAVAAVLGGVVAAMPGPTRAAGDAGSSQRAGKEVVDAVCVRCHGTGQNGAPRIGDQAAWAPRASQGLTSLSQHALNGIRRMPAHGGSPGLSDAEIVRAIIYMVNHSGGHWVEPVSTAALPLERNGQQVVRGQCFKCHEAGLNGAPRIGNLADWTPRMKYGVDYLVRSAVHGHGGMPARGGEADLTDGELRGAILYMINPKASTATADRAVGVALQGAGAADKGSNHAVAGNVEAFLGIVPAQSLLGYPPESVERTMHGGVPTGEGYYHLNVSLRDLRSQLPINDARVEVICEPKAAGTLGKTSKVLEPIAVGPASYGGYLRLTGGVPYSIAVLVRTAPDQPPETVRFEQVVF